MIISAGDILVFSSTFRVIFSISHITDSVHSKFLSNLMVCEGVWVVSYWFVAEMEVGPESKAAAIATKRTSEA